MPELAILSVHAPTSVKATTNFIVTVNVNADQEAFDAGAAYTLLLYVSGFNPAGAGPGLLGGTPFVQAGSLQSAPWTTTNATISFPTAAGPALTAGPAPDLYTVTAVLLLGPGKVFQGVLSASNPIAVT